MSGLAIHDTGEGPALLLLHAYPLDASQWDAQVAALSDRYRCLRPDFWGCGTSSAPPPDVTIDGYARDVLAELDERGVEEVAVCGSSMGGYVAFALLRAAPERLRAVVLAATRVGADTDATRAERARLAEQVGAAGVEVIVEPMTRSLLCDHCRDEVHIADPVRGRIRRWTTEGVRSVLAAMAGRLDSSAVLADLAVPVLVVCGTEDAIVPLEESRALAAAIGGAELVELEGTGHLPNLERPQEFSACVGQFLDARK